MTSNKDHKGNDVPSKRPLDKWWKFKQNVRILGKFGQTSLMESQNLRAEIEEEGGLDRGKEKKFAFLQGFAIFIILILIIAVSIYITKNSNILAGLSDDAPASISEINDPGESPDGFTAAELESQDPIAITDHPWIFIRNESVGNTFYAIYFESDELCSIPGNTLIYYCGYTVNGESVEIELFATTTAEAKNKEGDAVSEVVDWKEWFHLTRTGNAMRGSYEVESWAFSYEEGLVWKGKQIISETVLAYPNWP